MSAFSFMCCIFAIDFQHLENLTSFSSSERNDFRLIRQLVSDHDHGIVSQMQANWKIINTIAFIGSYRKTLLHGFVLVALAAVVATVEIHVSMGEHIIPYY